MTKRNDDVGRYIGVTFDPDWKPTPVAKMPDFPGAHTAHPLAPVRRTPRPPGWTRLDEMLRRIDDACAESPTPRVGATGSSLGDQLCASCGRARRPWHDGTAPGPTVRHPFKEPAVNLNGQADDSSLTPQPELTAAELATLGRQLDEQDFAAALGDSYARLGVLAPHKFATGGLVESTVDADHPPVGLGCPETQAGRAAIVHVHQPTPRLPTWRRLADRIRRRPR